MPRLDAERLELWRRVATSVASVRREIDSELRAVHGVSLVWFDAMSALRAAGGACRVGELCDAVADVPSSLSRRLDRMEADGLVERSGEPVTGDRRSVSVALTADGRQLWRDVNITHRRLVQHAFAVRLTETDVAALHRIVSKLEAE